MYIFMPYVHFLKCTGCSLLVDHIFKVLDWVHAITTRWRIGCVAKTLARAVGPGKKKHKIGFSLLTYVYLVRISYM